MITVVIPSHNRVDELKRALHSVYVQSEKPSEIIVIDDGSSPQVENSIFDDCPEEITTILLRNEIARGANHARNRGIKAASEEWIAFLDDDDEYISSKIKDSKTAISKCQNNVDVLYHPAQIKMVNEGVSYITNPMGDYEDGLFRKLLIKNTIGGTPMVLVKRDAIISVGYFDESMKSRQDYDLWLRLAKKGFKFKLLPKTLTRCYYRTETKSVSKSLDNHLESLKIIENKFSEDYKTLTDSEKKEHEQWKYNMRVHKALLNKQYKIAVKEQISSVKQFPSFKGFVQLIVVIFGSKFTFKIKSLIS